MEQNAGRIVPRKMPGPKGAPLIGSLREFETDRLHLFLRARKEYGDLVRFQVGRRVVHLVSGPELVKHVLQSNSANYKLPARHKEKFRLLVGQGLFTSDGELWRRQRQLVQSAMQTQKPADLFPVMREATAELLRDWERLAGRDEPVNVATAMRNFTVTIAARSLFGAELRPEEAATICSAMPFIEARTGDRFPYFLSFLRYLPTPGRRLYAKRVESVERIVLRLIEEKRRNGAGSSDLLSLLMRSFAGEPGEPAANQRLLRDQAMTLLLTSHESPSNNLSWTLYLLSKHVEVRKRLQTEVDQVLGGELPSLESLSELTYTRMVVEESLRVFPPAWMFGREAIASDEIGGFGIPPGAILIVCPYVTHRHPEHWSNPEGFEPERFTPERAKARHRYAYFPFGGGPRFCLGASFALMEATLAIAAIAQRYEVNLVPEHRVEPKPTLSLHPHGGILATIERRSARG